MSLRMLATLCAVAVAMATADDVIPRDNDVIAMTSPRDVFPGVGEYFYIGVAMTWTDAMKTCNSSNAHLLVIDSATEAAAIREMMITHGAQAIHLGFNDIFTEGKYNDIFGQPVDATCRTGNEWAEGYPVGNTLHNCGGFIQEGFMDTICEDKQVYICEIPNKTTGNTTKPGYILVPGYGYYKLQQQENMVNWTLADQTCRDEGSHLVIFNSQLEVDALRAAGVIANHAGYYVGIHRYFGGDQDFITVLGGTLADTGYVQWAQGHPVGSFSSLPFLLYYNTPADKGFYSTMGNAPNPYICEDSKY